MSVWQPLQKTSCWTYFSSIILHASWLTITKNYCLYVPGIWKLCEINLIGKPGNNLPFEKQTFLCYIFLLPLILFLHNLSLHTRNPFCLKTMENHPRFMFYVCFTNRISYGKLYQAINGDVHFFLLHFTFNSPGQHTFYLFSSSI